MTKEKKKNRTTRGYKRQFSVQDGLVSNIWVMIVYFMPPCFLKAFINFVNLMEVGPSYSCKILVSLIMC